MALNGRLPQSELHSIPSGELAIKAAACWNAPNGPASAGLYPTGSMSSYRTLAEQEYLWGLYQRGEGNLAAVPGTSNHGWGLAVDLAAEWMRSWIDDHGAKFGWRKTEAFSEWWHVNYDGSVTCKEKPPFDVLKKGDKGKRVRWYAKRLAFIHQPGGHAYLLKADRMFDSEMQDAVKAFQKAHKLIADGVIGEKTAHAISAVFHRQYVNRKGKRKRSVGMAIRETLATTIHGKPQHPQTKEKPSS